MAQKILFLLITTMFILSSCEESEKWTAYRRIINSTSHHITISLYETGDSIAFALAPADTVLFEGTCECCTPKFCHLGWRDYYYADILFDDSLVQHFEGTPVVCSEKAINADPYSLCFGYTQQIENHKTYYTYYITEADYHLAE